MLQVLRRGQRWVMWIVIVAVGGGMVVFLARVRGGGLGGSSEVAVAVGGRRYDFRDFDRVRQQQVAELRRNLGDAFDSDAAAKYLDQMAAGSLVREGLLAEEAEHFGLRVGEQEMREFLRSIPGGTGADGQLDRTAWTNHAEREYGSVARFEKALRDDLLASKASELIDESIALSDAEVREVLRHGLEEVQVAYVAVDPAALRAKQQVDDAEVDALLAKDLPRVQRRYDERKSEFDQPERVHARHILIRIPSGPDVDPAKAEAEARARAERAAARIRAGEPFAKVAAEVSEDPGSKGSGGDLGFFARGRMVPAFDEAAFSLEPGKISDPVKSPYGFHIIQVEEKRPAKHIAFDEVKRALARDVLVDEKADRTASEIVDKLVASIRDGKSLIDAARERGLVIERPDPVRRRSDGVIPGLGASKDALAAIFSLRDDKPTSDRVFEIGGKRVLFQRIGGKSPSDAELAPRIASTKKDLERQLRQQLEATWLDARRNELEKKGDLVYNLPTRKD